MIDFTVGFSGLDRIVRNTEEKLLDAKHELSERIVKRAQELAPVQSGKLKDSIHVNAEGDVDVDAPYAAYIEYGTTKRAPQPFLGPAIIAAESELEDVVTQKLNEVINGI